MQAALEISFRNLQCIIANIQGVTSESPRLKKVSAVLLKRHPLLQLFLYHATPYTPHCAFYLTHSFYRTPPLLSHALLLPNTTPFISRTPFTEHHPFYLTPRLVPTLHPKEKSALARTSTDFHQLSLSFLPCSIPHLR